MTQKFFAENVLSVIKDDVNIIGLAVAGSWISGNLDEYSDLDLILFTRQKISTDISAMRAQAEKFGKLLSSFTGEHVGEPRLLICLYAEPLLHVDIKFLTFEELDKRIEVPVVLYDPEGLLKKILENSSAESDTGSFQWIEDRFWIWIHYLAARLGRGEYFECIDGLTYIRSRVLGMLYHRKYELHPRGVRRFEAILKETEVMSLKETVPSYDRKEIVRAIDKTVEIYRELRKQLFTSDVNLRTEAERAALAYLDEIEWN